MTELSKHFFVDSIKSNGKRNVDGQNKHTKWITRENWNTREELVDESLWISMDEHTICNWCRMNRRCSLIYLKSQSDIIGMKSNIKKVIVIVECIHGGQQACMNSFIAFACCCCNYYCFHMNVWCILKAYKISQKSKACKLSYSFPSLFLFPFRTHQNTHTKKPTPKPWTVSFFIHSRFVSFHDIGLIGSIRSLFVFILVSCTSIGGFNPTYCY